MFGSQSKTGGGGSSMFGGSKTGGGGSSMFGGSKTGGGTSVFGDSKTGGGGSSMFGGNKTGGGGSSMFGGSKTGGGGSSMFGGNKTGGSMFGGGGGGMYGSRYSQQQQQQQQWAPTEPQDVQSSLEFIAACYDTSAPQCRFRAMFYNVLSPDEIGRWVPSNEDPHLLQYATANNPDPTRLRPTQASGVEDVLKRVETQEKFAQQIKTAVEQTQDTLRRVKLQHETHTLPKLEAYRRKYMDQSHRVLCIMKKLEIQRTKSFPVLAEEEELFARIAQLHAQLQHPTQFRGRLHELGSHVRLQADEAARTFKEDVVLDPEMIERTREFLERQTKGLKHLIDVLDRDTRDVLFLKRESGSA